MLIKAQKFPIHNWDIFLSSGLKFLEVLSDETRHMIVKDFVEFGHETSYTKSSSHTEFKLNLKCYIMGLVFILLAYFVIRL